MEFVLKIIFVLLLAGITVIVVHFVDLARNKSSYDRMSFRETMDLTGLPIVTFKQGENKFNFVLDTGACSSIIDSRVLDKLQYTELEGKSIGYGVDGVKHHMDRVGIVLTYKDKDYSDAFRVLDMAASFDALKRDYGVTVHGLLSSAFFERYKYVLDYNELVAYAIRYERLD